MKSFPNQIPIFPLSGVIYFPKTNLPLNIFEKRYLNLVEDCMKKNKYMGMVQSIKNSNNVYKIGCLGKITDYQVNGDGRILINLTGVSRFEILNEICFHILTILKVNNQYHMFDMNNLRRNFRDCHQSVVTWSDH